ncbi:MAG: hypothetical protein V3U92_10705 [Cellulophaga sp.]
MDVVLKALEFEKNKITPKTTNERIIMVRELKALILELNEVYKVNKDTSIMDIMKRLTVDKKKVEKRLKGRPSE